MTRRFKMLFAAAFAASQLSAALSQPSAGSAPDPDRALVESKCTGCHLASTYTNQHRSEAQWAETIERMMAHGAEITDAEYPRILAYLTRHHPAVPQNRGP
jgi:malonyl CoA-acyl carrier protein transacylase